MESLLVIANAGAGSSTEKRLDAGIAVLREAGDVQVARTGDDAELTAALDGRGDRGLVIAGGDGTIHRIVQALYDRGELADAPLGLLPLGTGNDFARGTGIPLDPVSAARIITSAELQQVDLVIDDDDEVVVNNAHVGVSAEASRYGARWKQRVGKPGYAIGLVQAVFAKPLRLKVEVDGSVVTEGRPLLEVSIGNGGSVGGGLPLNPGADPLRDGLDVIVSYATGTVERISYAVDLIGGRHGSRDDVWQTGDADHIVISGDPFYCSSDGEIDGPDPHRTWRRLRGAFRMHLPTPN